MKKNYTVKMIAFIVMTASLLSFNSSAQIVRLSEGFDNYIGSVATVPAGWYISWNSTSSPSYYFTAGTYGTAIPSYKFGNNGDFIISPYFLSGDTLKFWCSGQGTFSAQNSISILYSTDSLNWFTFQNVDSLPVTGTTLSFPLSCDMHYLKFVYNKVNGNLAFDDVLVTMTDYSPDALIQTTLNLHCEGDTVYFFDVSTLAGCDSIVSRVWDFGDSTATDSSANPYHVFALAGNYPVKLLVTASNGNSDSVTFNIAVNSLPVALFSDSNLTGTLVDFDDLSSIANGSIISWLWNFGDSTLSLQQNPMHIFPAVGTYFVCLTATSGAGCATTFCDSVNVIGVGIDDGLENFHGMYLSPNPVQGQFEVYLPGRQKLLPQFEMFDVNGNKLTISSEGVREKVFRITLPPVANGVYFLKVQAGQSTSVLKVLVAN